MRTQTLVAVAAGVLGALLLVAAWRGSFLGIVLGMMFSPVPLAMAALGLGLAYLPLAIVSGVVTVTVLTGSFALSTLYLVIDAAPVAILTRIALVAERQAQVNPDSPAPLGGAVLGYAVVSLALAAVLVMAAGLAAFPAGPGGLEAGLRDRLVELMAQIQAARGGAEVATDVMVKSMARVLPGAAAWNWAFRALISTVLAQRFLARDGFARWPTPAYRTLAVPGWYIGVFWIAAIAAWVAPGDAGFIVANAVAAMSLPLVLQGLAVVHTAIAWFGYGRLALIAFYCVALVAAGAAIALIVMLGVAEHFLQIRARRFGRPRDGGT
jgi:hypothetical protein